ncbi:unnamed protein product [Colias eurytheme]|nr:unnamed protein product [Colias eurytheme]
MNKPKLISVLKDLHRANLLGETVIKQEDIQSSEIYKTFRIKYFLRFNKSNIEDTMLLETEFKEIHGTLQKGTNKKVPSPRTLSFDLIESIRYPALSREEASLHFMSAINKLIAASRAPALLRRQTSNHGRRDHADANVQRWPDPRSLIAITISFIEAWSSPGWIHVTMLRILPDESLFDVQSMQRCSS